MNDMDTILDLTPSDYAALLRGYKLSVADNKMMTLNAEILRNKLSATDAKGKPKYTKLKQVYDYEKELREIEAESSPTPRIDPAKVRRFADSKARAEAVLNARRN